VFEQGSRASTWAAGAWARGCRGRMDSTDAPQIIEHVHKSLTFTPYDARWVPCSARLVCLGISTKAKGGHDTQST
jgi:hypothetical protein